MEEKFSDVDLRLSGQRALWGQVPSNLRTASVEFRGDEIVFQAVFSEVPSDDERQLLTEVAGYIAGDFPENHTLDEIYLVIPEPEKSPRLKNLLYQRYETSLGY